jgi:hypothetical protein
MKLYAALSMCILSFGTAASLLWFEVGLPDSQYVLLLKDADIALGVAVVVGIWLIDSRGVLRFDDLDIGIAIVLSVNTLFFFLSPYSITLRLTNYRKNVSLLLFFWAFYHLPPARSIVQFIRRWTYPIFVIIFAVGMIEYFLPNSFWNVTIHLPEYWMRNDLIAFPVRTVAESGRFYSWDYMWLFDHPIRRVVSLYTEPTTLAAFVAFVFCLSLFDLPWYFRVLIGGFGVLTISKFFFLSLLIIGTLYAIRRHLPKRLMIFCYVLFVGGAAVAVLLQLNSGTFSHLNGVANLSQLFIQKKFFGFGLGGAGNFGDDASMAGDIGEESGLGNITAQIGIGIFAYLLLFHRIFVRLRNRWIDSGDPHFLIGIMMWITWVLSFFLSASSLGISGNAFTFMYIASVLALDKTNTFQEHSTVDFTRSARGTEAADYAQ